MVDVFELLLVVFDDFGLVMFGIGGWVVECVVVFVVGKVFEVVIVVLFVGFLMMVLFGGVVFDYCVVVGYEFVDRMFVVVME